MTTIDVHIGAASVPIGREGFEALLDNSVVRDRKPYLTALQANQIRFDDLLELAQKAEVPYPLFFAPEAVVRGQLAKKDRVLLSGVSKKVFSLNSRSRLRMSDVELIVKDLIRKQGELKALDSSLGPNRLVGSLKASRAAVQDDARRLHQLIGVEVDDIRRAKNKEAAVELLISKFESIQVLVSRSQQGFMPQRLPRGVSFSGLCVRDKKVPYIFISSGSSAGDVEPAGRTVFTLVLLAVLAARGKFTAVDYRSQSTTPIDNREYQITEEFLLPATQIRALDVSSLEAVKAAADSFRVTPSAFTMRALRLRMIDPIQADTYFRALGDEFENRPKTKARSPKPINAVRKYSGAEYCHRMLAQLDAGRISPANFRRVVCLNRIPLSQIPDLRRALGAR